MPRKKKRYYPNNWDAYKNAPDEMFFRHTFEEFCSWKFGHWEIPSSVSTIIRSTNLETGKTKEFVYSRAGNARNKILQLIDRQEPLEITFADSETIHHLLPNDYIDEEDE